MATVVLAAMAPVATPPVFAQNAPMQLIPAQPSAGDDTRRLDGIEVEPLGEETPSAAPGASADPAPAATAPTAPTDAAAPAPVITAPADPTAPAAAAPATAPGTAPADAVSEPPPGGFTFDPDAPMPDGPIADERLDAARDRVEERAATRVLSDADLREMPVTELLNRLGRQGYVELRGISRTATGYRIDAINRSLEAVVIEFDPTTGVATERPR